MLDQQTAQMALQFLTRVQLNPQEIEAFQKVAAALQLIAQAQPVREKPAA